MIKKLLGMFRRGRNNETRYHYSQNKSNAVVTPLLPWSCPMLEKGYKIEKVKKVRTPGLFNCSLDKVFSYPLILEQKIGNEARKYKI